jgi:hypothetical protein
MLKWLVFNAVLFYTCVPGVLGTLGGKNALLVHTLVFLVLHHFLGKLVGREFFDNPSTNVPDKCPPGYKNSLGGDCVSASDVHGKE